MGDAMLRMGVLAVLMMIALALPAGAAVNESTLTITPENPTQGDVVVMQGKANPNEDIPITITFQMDVPVSGGTFDYRLNGVEIPSPNRFTVVAEGCRRLSVSASLSSLPFPYTLTSQEEGSTQTISQGGVPSGKYNIRIFGDAIEGASTVRLKVEAWTEIRADASGSFSYSYNSAPVPAGLFDVNVGGVRRTLMLSESEFNPSSPTPTPSPSPSGGGSSSSEGIYTSGPNPTDVYVPPENIEIQVVDYILAVVKDEHITHEFSDPKLDIRSIEFDSLGYSDELMVKVQELKNTSTLVDKPAPGMTYKSFRFFVDTQYNRIKNILINFRVENSWLENNSVNASSVALYRYANGQWNSLNTTLVGQDEAYTHYTASSPGFSVFAIVAQTHTNETATSQETLPTNEVNPNPTSQSTGGSATPSMPTVGLLGLTAVIMCAYGLLRRG